jgi:O-antigen/teichoic acid export membrane protein
VFTDRYASAGPYLALFLAMNALVQLAGGGSHEPALYVLGRQRWAVISRWGALGVMALGDALLIPRFGPMGALFAVGLGQILAEVFQLVLVRGAVARRYPLGFIVRLLAAMIIPVGVTVVWRPASLPGLVVAGVVYVVLFVACLWLIKPLDAEDGGLLQQLARPLRVALRPFVSAARRSAAPAASHALPLAAPIEAGTVPLPRDPSTSVSRPER